MGVIEEGHRIYRIAQALTILTATMGLSSCKPPNPDLKSIPTPITQPYGGTLDPSNPTEYAQIQIIKTADAASTQQANSIASQKAVDKETQEARPSFSASYTAIKEIDPAQLIEFKKQVQEMVELGVSQPLDVPDNILKKFTITITNNINKDKSLTTEYIYVPQIVSNQDGNEVVECKERIFVNINDEWIELIKSENLDENNINNIYWSYTDSDGIVKSLLIYQNLTIEEYARLTIEQKQIFLWVEPPSEMYGVIDYDPNISYPAPTAEPNNNDGAPSGAGSVFDVLYSNEKYTKEVITPIQETPVEETNNTSEPETDTTTPEIQIPDEETPEQTTSTEPLEISTLTLEATKTLEAGEVLISSEPVTDGESKFYKGETRRIRFMVDGTELEFVILLSEDIQKKVEFDPPSNDFSLWEDYGKAYLELINHIQSERGSINFSGVYEEEGDRSNRKTVKPTNPYKIVIYHTGQPLPVHLTTSATRYMAVSPDGNIVLGTDDLSWFINYWDNKYKNARLITATMSAFNTLGDKNQHCLLQGNYTSGVCSKIQAGDGDWKIFSDKINNLIWSQDEAGILVLPLIDK